MCSSDACIDYVVFIRGEYTARHTPAASRGEKGKSRNFEGGGARKIFVVFLRKTRPDPAPCVTQGHLLVPAIRNSYKLHPSRGASRRL